MPDFGSLGAGIFSNEAFNSGTSQPITITASASANTKGSYTELVAATDYAASWLQVTMIQTGSFAVRALTDIAIGGAGSEQVIIANIPRAWSYLYSSGQSLIFPVAIPAATRISARIQGSTGSHTQLIQVSTISASMPGPPALGVTTSYGMDTSDSGMTSIDPGGSAHTKGSYTQLTSSTSYPINWLTIFFGGDGAARTVFQYWLVDIAVGASSSEQVIVSNLAVASDANIDHPGPTFVQIPVQTIPAGTRISARCQCSVNTATARLLDVGIIGA